MKKIFTTWKSGWSYLLGDNLVSFYVFFTMIFAFCAWLFAYCELSITIPLTIVMMGYIANTMLFSWLKGNAEGTRFEVLFSFCYVAIFTLLFIVGLIIDWRIHLAIITVCLFVTLVAVVTRMVNRAFSIQGIALGVPIILLIVLMAEIPGLNLAFKIIIPVIYVICIPFIAYYEDSSAAQNIFELAYEHTWNPEFEKSIRELTNSDKDIVV